MGAADRRGERVRVEPVLVVAVGEAPLLLGVEAARGRDHRGAEVVAGLEPSRVRPEAVGQDGRVEPQQVVPQLGVGEVVVLVELDGVVRGGQGAQLGDHVRRVVVPARHGHLAVQVDPQPCVRQLADRGRERARHGGHVHVAAQALRVQTDDEAVVRRARAGHRRRIDDVRMRQDLGLPAPAPRDLPRRARRERHDGGGPRDEHPELGVVEPGLRMVGVAEIVDGDHERHARGVQRVCEGVQLLRRLGVEPEVDVEDVEGAVVARHPLRLEQPGRPPAARHALAAGQRDVGEAHHAVAAGRIAQVPHVDVVRGHRRDADRRGPDGGRHRRSRSAGRREGEWRHVG